MFEKISMAIDDKTLKYTLESWGYPCWQKPSKYEIDNSFVIFNINSTLFFLSAIRAYATVMFSIYRFDYFAT